MLLSLVFIVTLLGLGRTQRPPLRPPQSLADVRRESKAKAAEIQKIKTNHQHIIQEFERYLETVQNISNSQQQVQEQITALGEQLHELQSVPEDCPAGWSHHENSCYLIPPQKTSWPLAHGACAVIDRRAHLASVHSTSSQRIASLVDARLVYVGLLRLGGNAGWGWSDGTPLDYTKWAQGQPNGSRSHKHCGCTMRGVWYNCYCSKSNNFICQINLA